MFGLIPSRRGEGKMAARGEHPLSQLRNDFNTLFDQFFGGWNLEGNGHGWGVDVQDSGKEVLVKAEAPGFEAGEFDVQVSGDVLTIRAHHKEESGDKEHPRTVERRLERSVMLPAGVDAEKVEAHYRNGMLELKLARTEAAQAKRIEVKA
jgi:HSP20 family protein